MPSRPLRVAYFGSDPFIDCARLLVERGWPIVRVFTCRTDGPVVSGDRLARYARQIGVPVQRRMVTTTDIARLDGHVDVLISALYPALIPVAHTSARAINIHPSLLPVGRGAYPLVNALLRDLDTTGVTVHEMDAHFDTGAVLRQQSLSIGPGERAGTLEIRAHALAAGLLGEVIDDFDGVWASREGQSGGDYWPAPTDRDRLLDLNGTVDSLLSRVRAFGAYRTLCSIGGRVVEVAGASGQVGATTDPAGTVIAHTAHHAEAVVADGVVHLTLAPRRPTDEAVMRLRRLGWALDDRIRSRLIR
jgi:methionyl-tRNA formyltransferase